MGNNSVNGVDPDGGHCFEDMDMIYADVMHQMDVNLYDEIRMNGMRWLNEAAITPTTSDYLVDVAWIFGEMCV